MLETAVRPLPVAVSVQKSLSGPPIISEHDNRPDRLLANIAFPVMLPEIVKFWKILT